jgi:hypothetical protein
MTIFAVLLPTPQPGLVNEIRNAYPSDHLSITDTQWIISGTGTAIDVCAKLKIYDAKDPGREPSGSAVVFAVSNYFGRAPQNIWDWIKVKLEATPNG